MVRKYDMSEENAQGLCFSFINTDISVFNKRHFCCVVSIQKRFDTEYAKSLTSLRRQK